MEKLLNFEIRQVHSLDVQKKLPPAAARCASENQNYACEYDQCSPAFILTGVFLELRLKRFFSAAFRKICPQQMCFNCPQVH